MADDATQPRRVGRPPLLDEALIKRIGDIVRGGNYIETAAASVGIHRTTLHAWMREGAVIRRALDPIDGDDEYEAAFEALDERDQMKAQFSYTLEKAAAESETIDVLYVRSAAKDHWQAAMTRLERRHPKRWGRREAVEVSGQLDGVRIDADTPAEAVAASTALQSARARDAAADLIEALAGTPPAINQEGDTTHEPAPDA